MNNYNMPLDFIVSCGNFKYNHKESIPVLYPLRASSHIFVNKKYLHAPQVAGGDGVEVWRLCRYAHNFMNKKHKLLKNRNLKNENKNTRLRNGKLNAREILDSFKPVCSVILSANVVLKHCRLSGTVYF